MATIVGILIAGIVFTILGIVAISGMLMSNQPETVVKDNSIFVLELKGNVVERYQENPLDQLLVMNILLPDWKIFSLLSVKPKQTIKSKVSIWISILSFPAEQLHFRKSVKP